MSTEVGTHLGDGFFEHWSDVEFKKVKTGLIAREPVMAHAAATWFVAQLAGYGSMVFGVHWSGVATALYSLVSALVLFGLGKVLRERVSPARDVLALTPVVASLDVTTRSTSRPATMVEPPVDGVT